MIRRTSGPSPPYDVAVTVRVLVECVRCDDEGEHADLKKCHSSTAIVGPRLRFVGGTLLPAGQHSMVGEAGNVNIEDSHVICLGEASTCRSIDTNAYFYKPGAECTLLVPTGLSLTRACAAMPAALRAMSALLFRVPREACRGNVLIADGLSSWSFVAAQLAARWGARVIIHCADAAGALRCTNLYASVLRPLSSRPGHVVVVGPQSDLVGATMILTENQGADVILQLADQPSVSSEGDASSTTDSFLQCLGMHGHFCTAHPVPELDSAQLKVLSLKNASVHCLSDDSWLAAPKLQGRLLHSLSEFLLLLAQGDIIAPLAASVEPSIYVQDSALGCRAPGMTSADGSDGPASDILVPNVLIRTLHEAEF
jgi:NADPH:quinone reductase-like Zn-dependent oxidoreductase